MTASATTPLHADATVRTLPLRTAPLPGESLDSWLEVIAARYGVTLREIYESMGFEAPFTRLGLYVNRQLTDAEVAAVATASGCTPQQVRGMTLSRYSTVVGIDDTGRFTGAGPWGRVFGSRFCPSCLAATGGSWLLRWRLMWTFACLRHRCLLADRCPHCGAVQRYGYRAGNSVVHPGRCANPVVGTPHTWRPPCDADLTQAPVLVLPAEHPALVAQTTVDRLIDCDVVEFGLYVDHPQPPVAVLADIRALGNAIVHAVNIDDLNTVVAADLAGEYQATMLPQEAKFPVLHGRLKGFISNPAPAVRTAVVATAAFNILKCSTIDAAADALAALNVDQRQLQRDIPVKDRPSGSASPVLRAVSTASRGVQLSAVDQLRCRIGTPLPGRPARNTTRVDRRCGAIPALLWPAFAQIMCPPGPSQRHPRLALSAALHLVGTTTTIADAVAALGNATTTGTVSSVLRRLKRAPEWSGIRSVLIRLADYLDNFPPPIDYQRRRQLDYTAFLPDEEWARTARANFTTPKGAVIARGFLRERITGSPSIPMPVPREAESTAAHILSFCERLTPELLDALDEYALNFLAGQCITDEPVWWEPPHHVFAGVALPGIDIDTIDTVALHEMVCGRRITIAEAANNLGITSDAVRCVLERQPALRGPIRKRGRPRSTRRKEHRVTRHREHRFAHRGTSYGRAVTTFPRRRLVDLYAEQRQSLRCLAAQADVSTSTIEKLMGDYGIPVRKHGKIQIDRKWFHTQHVEQGRSLGELCRELGVSRTGLSTWAKRNGIPVRRLERHPVVELRANRRIPRFLKPALAGVGGWERLQRFADIVRYPSFGIAARELRLHSGYLSVQVQRLERDLGGRLVDRGHNRRPMRVTPFGKKVRQAVMRLAAAGGP